MLNQVQSLDPVDALPPVFDFPAYDPLIYQTAAGSYEPDLATSWGYAGSGHQVFRVSLRENATFDDGTHLTAKAAAASMNRFLTAKGAARAYAGPAEKVVATGPYTIEIYYSSPMPYSYLVKSLTQNFNFGMIVGPKGTANPATLADSSDGIGEYKLDPSKTTLGTTYTYEPNPLYFNQSAIRYDKIVLDVMPGASARLAAVESGQIDWAFAMPVIDVAVGKSQGLHTALSAGNTWSLILENETTGPLSDIRVRQAIEYAIPRSEILKSVYAGYGVAVSTAVVPGGQGYNAGHGDPYPYNVAKARQLLAAAGYPHGFTISTIDFGAIDPNGVFAQAVASALANVGITVHLTVSSESLAQLTNLVMSKAYQTLTSGLFSSDIYTLLSQSLTPGTYDNAFGLKDATLSRLLTQASQAQGNAAQDAGMVRVTDRLNQLAWVVPVAAADNLELMSSAVRNVPSRYAITDLDPFSPVTSQNWYSAGSS
jgi:peptide/nickel transport system substrate-binding protein